MDIGSSIHLPIFPHRHMATSEKAAMVIVDCLNKINKTIEHNASISSDALERTG
jgi:hypothetical protein